MIVSPPEMTHAMLPETQGSVHVYRKSTKGHGWFCAPDGLKGVVPKPVQSAVTPIEDALWRGPPVEALTYQVAALAGNAQRSRAKMRRRFI